MWAMMMAVSCAKAMLVILFFMHVMWEANWKYVLTIPASMMSMFLLLMLIPDIGRRTVRYSEERWYYAPKPVVHEPAPAGQSGSAFRSARTLVSFRSGSGWASTPRLPKIDHSSNPCEKSLS